MNDLSQTQGQPNIGVVAAGARLCVYSLPEGEVRIAWPARLSPESFEEIQVWLGLVASQMARAAGTKVERKRRRRRPPVMSASGELFPAAAAPPNGGA